MKEALTANGAEDHRALQRVHLVSRLSTAECRAFKETEYDRGVELPDNPASKVRWCDARKGSVRLDGHVSSSLTSVSP